MRMLTGRIRLTKPIDRYAIASLPSCEHSWRRGCMAAPPLLRRGRLTCGSEPSLVRGSRNSALADG